MLVSKYLKLQEEYTQKYGPNTILLMQVGTFYETYTYEPERDLNKTGEWPSYKIGMSREMASVINVVVTMSNKNKPYSITNCFMAGFPVVAYEKYRDILLANNFTLVRMDQKKEVTLSKTGKSQENTERYIAEIISPSTNLENLNVLPLTTYITSIYIEVIKESFSKEDYTLVTGLSSVDVTTGDNLVTEVYSSEADPVSALHEIYRYLSGVKPKEIIVNLVYKVKNNENKIKEYEEYISSILNLSSANSLVFYTNKVPEDYYKIDYCNKFFSKIFNPPIANSKIKLNIKNNPNIIEDLGIERYNYGRLSYIVLLNYCYEHNNTLVEKLSKPNTSWLNGNKYLILTHNAIDQLDILPGNNSNVKSKHNRKDRNIDSLFSVVNFTKTALGKRYLTNALVNPITDVNLLRENYNMIQFLIEDKALLKEIQTLLKDIPDLERYQRKLYLKLIKPQEFVILFKGYIQLLAIYNKISDKESLKTLLFDTSSFNECLSFVLSKYKLDVLSKYKIEGGNKLVNTSSFNEDADAETEMNDEENNGNNSEEDDTDKRLIYEGKDKTYDELYEDLRLNVSKINNIVNILNGYISSTVGKKLTYKLKDKKDKNLALWTTQHKANILINSKYPKDVCGDLKFSTVNKDIMITSDIISTSCYNAAKGSENLSKYLYTAYYSMIFDIAGKYKFFSSLSSFIGKIDYLCSAASCASENNYYKPVIEERKESYIEIEEMRHPIVETLIQDGYITNDVGLGDKTKGILLYGQNSSGKSTLGKAIALNVILAQSGLYTAGKTKFYPYEKIVTRLSGHDSILTGESSFVVEMKELRTILNNSGNRTLVIADELSRGTESKSATCLTIAAIEDLMNSGSSFLFSTHLHDLVERKEIKNLTGNLRICHLALKYDKVSNMLIYERKLKEGSGDSVYGLEVAASLGLKGQFIKRAYEIRNDILRGGGSNGKKSAYNGKVYVDTCFLCGKQELDKLETHHVIPQSMANENGFIISEGIAKHKNVPGNLIEICTDCHDSLHKNGLKIVSTQTSKGIGLTVV